MGSRLFSVALREASAIAGAVFLPKGSKIIEFGLTFISLNCSAKINLCSELEIIIGFPKFFKLLNLK